MSVIEAPSSTATLSAVALAEPGSIVQGLTTIVVWALEGSEAQYVEIERLFLASRGGFSPAAGGGESSIETGLSKKVSFHR